MIVLKSSSYFQVLLCYVRMGGVVVLDIMLDDDDDDDD